MTTPQFQEQYVENLLDFTLFHNLCRHLSHAPGASWSVITIHEKPVFLHTTGIKVAGYVDTYSQRLHFKPHQVRQRVPLDAISTMSNRTSRLPVCSRRRAL